MANNRQDNWKDAINLIMHEREEELRSGRILVHVVLIRDGVREKVSGILMNHDGKLLVLDTSEKQVSFIYIILKNVLTMEFSFVGSMA